MGREVFVLARTNRLADQENGPSTKFGAYTTYYPTL